MREGKIELSAWPWRHVSFATVNVFVLYVTAVKDGQVTRHHLHFRRRSALSRARRATHDDIDASTLKPTPRHPMSSESSTSSSGPSASVMADASRALTAYAGVPASAAGGEAGAEAMETEVRGVVGEGGGDGW